MNIAAIGVEDNAVRGWNTDTDTDSGTNTASAPNNNTRTRHSERCGTTSRDVGCGGLACIQRVWLNSILGSRSCSLARSSDRVRHAGSHQALSLSKSRHLGVYFVGQLGQNWGLLLWHGQGDALREKGNHIPRSQWLR